MHKQVWGGSRALFNAMHAWSLEGKACFYECFMGLVAREEGLRSVAVGHPAFGGPSYHCDAKVAEELYQRWSNTSSECLHSGTASLVSTFGSESVKIEVWQVAALPAIRQAEDMLASSLNQTTS